MTFPFDRQTRNFHPMFSHDFSIYSFHAIFPLDIFARYINLMSSHDIFEHDFFHLTFSYDILPDPLLC